MTVITTNSGQIQTTKERTSTIQQVLADSSVRKALSEVLPKHIDTARFTRVAMSSLRRNPRLLQCNPTSFLSALLQSAALGLEPDTALGHSYLVPYGKEATLVVGYEGYMDLAYRSGVVSSIHANVVRDADEFDWGEGSEPYITHRPLAVPQSYTQNNQTFLSGRDVTHAYAVARLIGGGHVQVVMVKSELDAIKSRSRASHDGPWVTDPVAMMKKTAIRQLRKFLPMSANARSLHMAAALDEQADAGLAQAFDVPADLFDVAILDAEPDAPVENIAEESQDPPAPSEYGRCPLHGAAWALNKYGHSHSIEGSNPKEYCNPSTAALAIAAAAGMDSDQLNEWLRARYGITRSKLEPHHLLAVHAEISKVAVAGAQDMIVVPDAEEWPSN